MYPNFLCLHCAVFRLVYDFDLSDPLSIPIIHDLQGGMKIDGVVVFKTVRILHSRDSNYHQHMNDKEPTYKSSSKDYFKTHPKLIFEIIQM
jgi:hypothetical protein